MKTYQEIKARLDDLSNEELQALMAAASATIDKRKEGRKKELWGNVVAAIKKYEQEIGLIEVYCRECGEEGTLDNFCQGDEPGRMSFC